MIKLLCCFTDGKKQMPRIYFNLDGKKYSMVFAEEGNDKFVVVSSESGITKKIIYEGYSIRKKVTVRDFLSTVKELFA